MHTYLIFSVLLWLFFLEQILWSEITGTKGLHGSWHILTNCPLELLFQFISSLALFWKCLTTSRYLQQFFICILAFSFSFILWTTRSDSLTYFYLEISTHFYEWDPNQHKKHHLNIKVLSVTEKILFTNDVPLKE